jgi:4-amino-4-deoxy-L-arabinose transferase-like glycosyltransferase
LLILGFLPLAALGLGILLLHRQGGGGRIDAVPVAPLLWAYGVALVCEALSLFQALTFASLVVIWGLAVIALILLLLRTRPHMLAPRRWLADFRQAAAGMIAEEWALGAVLLIIGGATLLIAFLCPPGTWDSQSYHLPRIEHWIQDGSLAFYRTAIDRQLTMPGLAELLILQLRLLSGGDRLDNLVQWLAGAGVVYLVGRIARALGGSRRGIAFARLVAATLPIGILESSSTQNDLVAAFFLLAMAERLLAWRGGLSSRDAAFFAIAAGIALATKGTSYLIGLPFGLWFLAANLKAGRRALPALIACGVLILLPNLPSYLRNLDYSGSPLGGGEVTNNASFGPGALVVNGARSLAVNLATGNIARNKRITKLVDTGLGALGLDANDPALTFINTKFELLEDQTSENIAGNPLKLVLGIASVVVVLLAGGKPPFPRRCYALCLLAGGLLFVIVLRWQPWITRLQLPLFVFAAPLAACLPIEGGRDRWYRRGRAILGAALAIGLIAFAWRPLWENSHRPLFPPSGFADSIWAKTGTEILFLPRPELQSSYEAAARYAAQQGDSRIGLLTAGNDWEHPLWRLLRQNGIRHLRIEHVGVEGPPLSRPYPLGRFDPTLVIATIKNPPPRLSIDGAPWQRVMQYPHLAIYRRAP